MTSEREDEDNFKIAMSVMNHDTFRSESEDMDNMARCTKAGVRYPNRNTTTKNNNKKTYPITDRRNPYCNFRRF